MGRLYESLSKPDISIDSMIQVRFAERQMTFDPALTDHSWASISRPFSFQTGSDQYLAHFLRVEKAVAKTRIVHRSSNGVDD